MRRYSSADEERIRMQRRVREWARSGLLDRATSEALAADLRVNLRRTNPFLRAGLALFAMLIVAALVGFVMVSLDIRNRSTIAAIAAAAAIACIVAADVLAGVYRCYRFGIEEALAVAAVLLLCFSGSELSTLQPDIVPLVIGAGGGYAVYRRFGFIYAAIGAATCLALIPFAYELPAGVQRVVAAAIAGLVFVSVRSPRLKFRDDYPGDDYGVLQAAALAGVYAAVNIQIGPARYAVTGWLYWCSYVLTWMVPLAAVRVGIRDRDRELMDVGLALTLVTVVTNKSYLGWARNTWDPIVFGVVVIAAAVLVRRWLDAGPEGERHGFTAARILETDRDRLSLAGVASTMVPTGSAHTAGPAHTESTSSQFGGGRSGGGGGGDQF